MSEPVQKALFGALALLVLAVPTLHLDWRIWEKPSGLTYQDAISGTNAAHVGERIQWAGEVFEVNQSPTWIGHDYEVRIDMNGIGWQEIYLRTNDDRAKTLEKGSSIRFTGRITSVIGEDVVLDYGDIR